MPSAESLTNAALQLAQAVARHEVERSIESADAVIAARLAVKEVFIEAGWQPSDRALRQMQADRDLLSESAGVLDRPESSEDSGQEGRHERSAVRHVAGSAGMRVVHVAGRPRRPERSLSPWERGLPGLA